MLAKRLVAVTASSCLRVPLFLALSSGGVAATHKEDISTVNMGSNSF